MRLLHVKTRQLEEFFGEAIPQYAILSHTWGRDEVTFLDLEKENHQQKHGYAKIEGCCKQAASDGLDWAWIDTCCIDKSSSAELSEAINSMFQWYQASQVCYAYLEDVPPGEDPFESGSTFRTSHWFTRGWTLQELIAPGKVIFFDSEWTLIFSENVYRERSKAKYADAAKIAGEDDSLRCSLLRAVTGIEEKVLRNPHMSLPRISAACKLSWAAQRKTTRVEDTAYCLLGLLGVNMPLLYGEGEKAFIRLQEAVIGSSSDISLLAWGFRLPWEIIEELGSDSVLAKSPNAFSEWPQRNSRHVRRTPRFHATMTGYGLHLQIPLLSIDSLRGVWIGIVEEYLPYDQGGNETGIALVLRQKGQSKDIFERASGCPPISIYSSRLKSLFARQPTERKIYLQHNGATTALNPFDFYKSKWTFFRYMPTAEDSNMLNSHEPILLVALSEGLRTGSVVSSIYPPVARYYSCPVEDVVGPDMHYSQRWKLASLFERTQFRGIVCQGAGNHEFFFVISNCEGEDLAVHVQVQFGSNDSRDFVKGFKVRIARYKRDISERFGGLAALSLARNIGLVNWTASECRKKGRWRDYANLESAPKGHVRAVPGDGQKMETRIALCRLVWAESWIDEEPQ